MNNCNEIIEGWFSEICPMFLGIALSIEIEKTLYSKQSKFQKIDLYQTKKFGKMLVLDGIIQLTESDEFAYHEMLTHIPMFSHPNPKNILVIGGGDGGILRELGRHECIQRIDFCEIDEDVINVSKEFLPDIACGFDDPRIAVYIGDGNAYVHEQKDKYDVVIVDSSDPIGPSEILFKKSFYKALKEALKPNGIIATQGESFFLHKELVTSLVKITREIFPVQAYAYIMVPTYPGGNIGVCLGSLGPDLKNPCRKIADDFQKQLKYYNSEVHKASFTIPHFAKNMFDNI